MRHLKKYIIPVAALMLLSGCALSMPPQTLSQKLEGKSAAERAEILRLACLNEAEYSTLKKAEKYRRYGTRRHTISNTQETTDLKTLCRAMSENQEGK